MKLNYETRDHRPRQNGVWLWIGLVFYGIVGGFGWLMVISSSLGAADQRWIGIGVGGTIGFICWSRLWRLAQQTNRPAPIA